MLKKLGTGDDLGTAREIVTFLVLHYLTTKARLEIPRLRCKNVLPSGRRVLVGPFGEFGIDLASVADDWTSPDVALAAIFTPQVKRK